MLHLYFVSKLQVLNVTFLVLLSLHFLMNEDSVLLLRPHTSQPNKEKAVIEMEDIISKMI